MKFENIQEAEALRKKLNQIDFFIRHFGEDGAKLTSVTFNYLDKDRKAGHLGCDFFRWEAVLSGLQAERTLTVDALATLGVENG